MINTDTKRLRRDEESFFSVAPQGVLSSAEPLCGYCGADACKIKEAIAAALRGGTADAPVMRCRAFVPVISFSVLDGVNLEAWNTIRIGTAWSRRLAPGSKIAVMDLKLGRIVREMRVERVVTGTIGSLCDGHGFMNHAALAKGWPGSVAGEQMRRVLRNAYGSRFAAPDKDATAIYLKAS